MSKLICGYDLDSNQIILPEHVRQMAWSDQVRWAKERGMQPAAEARKSAGFMARAQGILDATKRRFPGMEGVTALYSMYEMMQPFQQSDGVAVTAAAETVLTQDTILTLPANFFSIVGKKIWLRVAGKQSNVVTTPGTYTFRLRYSGIGGAILAASGAIVPNPVAVTDNLWYADLFLRSDAVGQLATSLTLLCYGKVELANADASLASTQAKFMPAGGTSLASVTGQDGTTAKALTLTVQPTVATGSITVREAWITAQN